MSRPLTPAEAKRRNSEAFKLFWDAYPRKTAKAEAERVFSELVQIPADADHLIKMAREYAARVDPKDMTYVPAPHSWLRQGRYDDADLFTNDVTQQREWFRQCWREANVKALEQRFHITFEKTYPPEDMTDSEAIRLWYRETARAWIAKIAKEKMRIPD